MIRVRAKGRRKSGGHGIWESSEFAAPEKKKKKIAIGMGKKVGQPRASWRLRGRGLSWKEKQERRFPIYEEENMTVVRNGPGNAILTKTIGKGGKGLF